MGLGTSTPCCGCKFKGLYWDKHPVSIGNRVTWGNESQTVSWTSYEDDADPEDRTAKTLFVVGDAVFLFADAESRSYPSPIDIDISVVNSVIDIQVQELLDDDENRYGLLMSALTGHSAYPNSTFESFDNTTFQGRSLIPRTAVVNQCEADHPYFLFPTFETVVSFQLQEYDGIGLAVDVVNSTIPHFVFGSVFVETAVPQGSAWYPEPGSAIEFQDDDWGCYCVLSHDIYTPGSISEGSYNATTHPLEIDLIVVTPESRVVVARWRQSQNSQFATDYVRTFGPSGIGPKDSFQVKTRLVEVVGSAGGPDPPSDTKRKYRARYQVWWNGSLIFEETSTDKKELGEWLHNQRPKYFGFPTQTGEAWRLKFASTVSYPQVQSTEVNPISRSLGTGWSAITGETIGSVQWSNTVGIESNDWYPDAIAFDRADTLDNLESIELQGASWRFAVDPFSLYQVLFEADLHCMDPTFESPTLLPDRTIGTATPNFVLREGDRVLFGGNIGHIFGTSFGGLPVINGPPEGTIKNKSRGRLIVEKTRPLEVAEVIERVPCGFYFMTQNQNYLTISASGYTLAGLNSGKIHSIRLRKLESGFAAKNFAPYQRKWSASTDKVFSGWLLYTSSAISSKTIKPEVSKTPGIGPWNWQVCDGALPIGWSLNSSNGEITTAFTTGGSISESYVSFLITDSTGAKFRTIQYIYAT